MSNELRLNWNSSWALICFCLIVLFVSIAGSVLAEPWTFEKLVQYAHDNGPEVEIAKERVNIASAQREQAYSAYWPRLQVQSGYAQTNNPAYSFSNILNQKNFSPAIDFNNVPTTDNFLVRGLASVTLYSGGRDSARQEAANANLEDYEIQKKIVENDYTGQVAISYFELLRADELEKSMKSAVRSFEANEKSASGRASAGTALKTELLDIQVQLENAREGLVRAQNLKKLLIESLKSLLGIEDTEFDVEILFTDIKEPEFGKEKVTRSELKALAARKRAAKAQIEEATAGYLPRISLQSGYEYNEGWKYANGNGTNYTVGVVGEWDIWDGFLTARKTDEARAQLKSINHYEKRLQQNLNLALSQAKIKLQEAKDAFEITKKAEKIAGESAELTRLRFGQGLASSNQLIDAEHALTTASVRQAQAKVDRYLAVLLLRRALDLGPIDFKKE